MVTSGNGDLGSVYPGAVGTEVLLTVINGCSTYDLGNMSVAVYGTDASVFRVSTNTCNNLTRSSSCVIGVELAPPADAQPKTAFGTMTVVGANGELTWSR